MTSKVFLVFLCYYIAYGCTSFSTQGDGSVEEIMVGDNKVFVCLFDKVKSGTATIPLSSLVEDFEMVQLETNENAIFHPYSTITVTENYIGVKPHYADNYKLFDRSGKFLRTLSRRGKGPGEYQNSIDDDIIDEKNGLVYLSAFPGKILVYSISGQLLKEIVTPPMSSPKMFLSDGILTLVHYPRFWQTKYSTWNEADVMMYKYNVSTGELLEKLAPPFEHLIVRKQGADIQSPQNITGVFDFFPNYYATNQYDTLYHIDVKKNKFIPFFSMKYDLAKRYIPQHDQYSKPRYYQLNKDLMLSVIISSKPDGFYHELIATDLKNKVSSWVKIQNDYIGNIDALGDFSFKFRKGYYVYSIQPEDLMEDIEERLAERNCTETDREVLKKTLSKLKEGANNVVFIGKLEEEIKTKLW